MCRRVDDLVAEQPSAPACPRSTGGAAAALAHQLPLQHCGEQPMCCRRRGQRPYGRGTPGSPAPRRGPRRRLRRASSDLHQQRDRFPISPPHYASRSTRAPTFRAAFVRLAHRDALGDPRAPASVPFQKPSACSSRDSARTHADDLDRGSRARYAVAMPDIRPRRRRRRPRCRRRRPPSFPARWFPGGDHGRSSRDARGSFRARRRDRATGRPLW